MIFWNLFTESGKKLFKTKILFLYSAFIIGFLFLISFFANYIVQFITKQWIFHSWGAFASILSLLVLAFVFSEMVGISIEGYKSSRDYLRFQYGRKYFWRSLSLLIVIIILGMIIQQASIYLAFYAGKIIQLDVDAAKILFLAIYGAGLLCILIFFSFSIFFCIKENLSIRKSIRKSFSFVKYNYVKTLLSLTIFYILWQLLILIPNYGEIIASFFITPVIAIWMSELISKENEYNL